MRESRQRQGRDDVMRERDRLEAAIHRALRYLLEGDEQHAVGVLLEALVDAAARADDR